MIRICSALPSLTPHGSARYAIRALISEVGEVTT
jgi:hypothetical protein